MCSMILTKTCYSGITILVCLRSPLSLQLLRLKSHIYHLYVGILLHKSDSQNLAFVNKLTLLDLLQTLFYSCANTGLILLHLLCTHLLIRFVVKFVVVCIELNPGAVSVSAHDFTKIWSVIDYFNVNGPLLFCRQIGCNE